MSWLSQLLVVGCSTHMVLLYKAAIPKLWPNFDHAREMSRSLADVDHRPLLDITKATGGWQKSMMYCGACSCVTLYVSKHSLQMIFWDVQPVQLVSHEWSDVIIFVSSIDDVGRHIQHSLELIYLFVVDHVLPTNRAVQQATFEATKLLTRVLAASSGSARWQLLIYCSW